LSTDLDPAGDACPFCAIAEGRDPDARVVVSGAEWVAFFPPQPATRGHTLIISRAHVADFWSAEEPTVAVVAVAARKVGLAIRRALQPDGINLITSAGMAAEQTVFHLHLHVVPRWENDRFGAIWPPKGLVPPREVDDALERIRLACNA
jgi:histidine triad (HIT) family protein